MHLKNNVNKIKICVISSFTAASSKQVSGSNNQLESTDSFFVILDKVNFSG